MPIGNALEHEIHMNVMHEALILVLMNRVLPTLFCLSQQ